jgi:hypothetical protein
MLGERQPPWRQPPQAEVIKNRGKPIFRWLNNKWAALLRDASWRQVIAAHLRVLRIRV